MTLKLMYITNEEKIAKIAENNGVEWIFIDLEVNGKEERQGHLNSVISRHNIHDIKRIKQILNKSEVLVRVNPIYEESEEEINKVIKEGADIIMLPFFKTPEEVQTFIDYIDGRVKTCLLLETVEAVENIDSILNIEGIDYIHIGLNDLHLGYGMKFMFELLANGTVEFLCNKIKGKGIIYGFGGIARIGHKVLPAENIITEHYRLGSSMVILSRSFCNSTIDYHLGHVNDLFHSGINEIRNFETTLEGQSDSYFIINKNIINEKISSIINPVSSNF
ncbi:aldolase/citrate lyase family protein [Planococcus liqunii]|uniref:Aldolase/citrate lyase family protein n=1 Tax=Planococcus liqunii TaxID=3058394 RepID=A0ABT8MNK0_9BACL|nr:MULTISPECIES: aldolase/citrate lyase family protein [unclassified Planococcus (in: firmicutes)]MDN7226408.1 aldolase/citrate lyase family protein [Planococcus sp. N064]WKA50181.1 aldolase/citrate lyase family protein [Planococcus sp. N056]